MKARPDLPLNLMRPSGVRLACVIMPLYSTVNTSSAGVNRPSSTRPRSVTVPAGRLGAFLGPPLGAAGCFFARDCDDTRGQAQETAAWQKSFQAGIHVAGRNLCWGYL
jgi:hypothetical protein